MVTQCADKELNAILQVAESTNQSVVRCRYLKNVHSEQHFISSFSAGDATTGLMILGAAVIP
jgi:hypothetical protein